MIHRNLPVCVRCINDVAIYNDLCHSCLHRVLARIECIPDGSDNDVLVNQYNAIKAALTIYKCSE